MRAADWGPSPASAVSLTPRPARFNERGGNGGPGHLTAVYQPNFITECFFLTAVALHLSLVRVFMLYNHVTRELRELKKVVDDMTASRPTWTVRAVGQTTVRG